MSFYYDRLEKIGIYLAVLAVGYLLWRWLAPYVFSGLGRALGAHKMVPLPSADLREARPEIRAAAVRAASAVGGFDRRAVAAADGDWEEASRLNAVLAGLAAQRQPRVGREGALRTKVVWKVAVFHQAALHRLAALATGCAAAWNSHNVLGAAMAARAVQESVALLLDFERHLQRLCSDGDLGGIDALVMERGFANPLDGGPDAGVQHGFDTALLDAGQAPDGLARAHYDALSGLCDAGALGQYRVFGELDKAGTAVTFSAEAGYERGLFGHVLGGLGALVPAEAALRAIEEKLPLVAALEAAAV